MLQPGCKKTPVVSPISGTMLWALVHLKDDTDLMLIFAEFSLPFWCQLFWSNGLNTWRALSRFMVYRTLTPVR